MAMTLVLTVEPIPLRESADGVMLVGETRVTLDTVISAFNQGVTAEEIVCRYPSLKLADVYSTIAYYLSHVQDVEAYLANRQVRSKEVREMNEVKFPPQGLRDRLLARQGVPQG
jgi:uncharacterized protein (DUF433 family)